MMALYCHRCGAEFPEGLPFNGCFHCYGTNCMHTAPMKKIPLPEDDDEGPTGKVIGILLILVLVMAAVVAWKWDAIVNTFLP